MNHFIRLSCTLCLCFLLNACSGNSGQKTIHLAYVNWAEGIAMTHVAEQILETHGYRVKLLNADPAPIFASMARGSVDVFMDTWLPVTHHDYIEKYKANLEIIGTNFNDARIGLVVPSYVTINSIDELNAHKDQFKSQIVGIDAGAGIMKAAENAIPTYGLDYELLTSSGAAMTATLKKAIDAHQWIVVTGWTPHWMFSRFDLKILKDPKKAFGNAEQIKTTARKGYSKSHPKIAQFFKNISFDNAQIGELLAVFQNYSDPKKAAKVWIKDHPKMVASWIPENFGPQNDSGQ